MREESIFREEKLGEFINKDNVNSTRWNFSTQIFARGVQIFMRPNKEGRKEVGSTVGFLNGPNSFANFFLYN